jgi:ADP-L-glycero-D-manno-heptose 6-epimerase
MNSALVTGNLGFIGKNLSIHLQSKGLGVYGLEEEIFNDANWAINLHKYLEETRPDAIFHVGASSNTLETRVQYTMERNFLATKILTDWARLNTTPLIFSSSAANYGVNGLFPANLYGWSKFVAESYVVSNGGVALRYFNVYGPGESQKGNMASYFFQAITMMKKGIIPELFPGSPKRDFIYIDDVIDANLHSLKYFNKLRGKVYDVGTCEPRTFEDGLNQLKITFKYAHDEQVPDGYQFYTCADPKKRPPNWKHKFNLESGLEMYIKCLSIT